NWGLAGSLRRRRAGEAEVPSLKVEIGDIDGIIARKLRAVVVTWLAYLLAKRGPKDIKVAYVDYVVVRAIPRPHLTHLYVRGLRPRQVDRAGIGEVFGPLHAPGVGSVCQAADGY